MLQNIHIGSKYAFVRFQYYVMRNFKIESMFLPRHSRQALKSAIGLGPRTMAF